MPATAATMSIDAGRDAVADAPIPAPQQVAELRPSLSQKSSEGTLNPPVFDRNRNDFPHHDFSCRGSSGGRRGSGGSSLSVSKTLMKI